MTRPFFSRPKRAEVRAVRALIRIRHSKVCFLRENNITICLIRLLELCQKTEWSFRERCTLKGNITEIKNSKSRKKIIIIIKTKNYSGRSPKIMSSRFRLKKELMKVS